MDTVSKTIKLEPLNIWRTNRRLKTFHKSITGHLPLVIGRLLQTSFSSHSLHTHEREKITIKILIPSESNTTLTFTTRQNRHHHKTTAIPTNFNTSPQNYTMCHQPDHLTSQGCLKLMSLHITRHDNTSLVKQLQFEQVENNVYVREW